MTTLTNWARAVFGPQQMIEVPAQQPVTAEASVSPPSSPRDVELAVQSAGRMSAMAQEITSRLMATDIELMMARISIGQAKDGIRARTAKMSTPAEAAELLRHARKMAIDARRFAAWAEEIRREVDR